jgi:hypothetical protein
VVRDVNTSLDKGILLRSYLPSTSKKRFVKWWLRSLFISGPVLTAFLIYMMFFLFGDNWPPEFIGMILLFIGMMIFADIMGEKAVAHYSRPSHFYSNGLQGFSTMYYRLRGLNGFIDKDSIDHVQVHSIYLQSAVERGTVSREESEKSPRTITIHLRNGKQRIVAYGDSEEIEDLIRIVKGHWKVQVLDPFEKTRKTA